MTVTVTARGLGFGSADLERGDAIPYSGKVDVDAFPNARCLHRVVQ